MTDPWARPPQQPPTPGEPPTQQFAQPGDQRDATQRAQPQSVPPPEYRADAGTGAAAGAPEPKRPFVKRMFSDPLSIGLVLVIVLALVVAGVVIVELYARSRGNEVVAKATACVVQDEASASFGASPFLIQYLTGHYGNISIETAGNQIREAKGMKAQIEIDDVRLADNGNSKGTIGALDATITWSADGIKQTIQNTVPLIGGFVTGVTANPSDGTIELQGALGSIVAKPGVTNDGISLEVQQLTGLGFTLPREAVQPALDVFSEELTKNYPLGIKADSVQVTDTGVIAKFSTQNATIPAGGEDPCFAGL